MNVLIYWITTALFSLVLAFGGFAHFTHEAGMVESMTALGYPLHFMTILGLAKMLGALALLLPVPALIKEWAYAGFTFNLLGATTAHLLVGDPLGETFPPFVLWLVLVTSYATRPDHRRVGSTPELDSSANPLEARS